MTKFTLSPADLADLAEDIWLNAVGEDDGVWEDFPGSREVALAVAEIVAGRWDDIVAEGGERELAEIEFAKIAAERGIVLVTQ